MTLLAEAAGVDRDVVDQQFTEIYAECFERLCRFIRVRMDVHQGHLAEDLAQEVFMQLWRRMLKGTLREAGPVYVLLSVMAKGAISAHYEKKGNRERSHDFADVASAPLVVTGHSYAADVPGLASLAVELDTAMARMSEASKLWREKHKESYRFRGLLVADYMASRGGATPETRLRATKSLAVADAAEDEALVVFQQTCAVVGHLRAELEAAAGPRWRSSIGLPTNPSITPILEGRYRNDLAVTHCPAGHALDRDSTHFGEDGSRRCRPCHAAQQGKARQEERAAAHARQHRPTVNADAVNAARALLMDSSNADRSLKTIAASVGVSAATLYRRAPEAVATHRTHRQAAKQLALVSA
jgi:DNA-directed RNA polymerase specialized sigma24 family protein